MASTNDMAASLGDEIIPAKYVVPELTVKDLLSAIPYVATNHAKASNH